MELKILKFSAPWCSPCRILTPILEEVAKEMNVLIRTIDIDEDIDSMEDYSIRSIPTLVFIKDGMEVGRTIGSINKQQLISKIKSVI